MSITSRELLVNNLRNYSTAFAEELPFVKQFLALLNDRPCYKRDHLPGHITGSAWIVNSSMDCIVLVHHAKLNKWLQPGGHADGDENILNVALREAEEETGLKNLRLLYEGLFDIDIHPIPERKDFPEHLHYDVRFAFQADSQEPLFLSEESHGLAWIKFDDLASKTKGNVSILRMLEKTKRLTAN